MQNAIHIPLYCMTLYDLGLPDPPWQDVGLKVGQPDMFSFI